MLFEDELGWLAELLAPEVRILGFLGSRGKGWGLGFGDYGLGSSIGFRVLGLGFWDYGLGSGIGFRV